MECKVETGHVIRWDKENLCRHIIEWRDQKMWIDYGTHCREGEKSKVKMVWTHNKKRWRNACHRHRMKRSQEDVEW